MGVVAYKFPMTAYLCSASTEQEVCRHVSNNLRYYQATDEDCEIVHINKAADFQLPIKTHFSLKIKTYVGWKVYMLTTGCFAYDPEAESLLNANDIFDMEQF